MSAVIHTPILLHCQKVTQSYSSICTASLFLKPIILLFSLKLELPDLGSSNYGLNVL